MVLNDYKSGGISVLLGDAKAGVDLLEASCSIDCSEDAVFDIKVKASYSVEDLNGDSDMDNGTVARTINEYLKKTVESAIKKSQDLNADYMGFADCYFDKHAKDLPGGLENAKFNVTVDGKLQFKGIEY
jgi:hypothetical protein